MEYVTLVLSVWLVLVSMTVLALCVIAAACMLGMNGDTGIVSRGLYLTLWVLVAPVTYVLSLVAGLATRGE